MKCAKNWRDATQRFWADVEELLIQEHHNSSRSARKGIKDYKRVMRNHQMNGVVFNQGEEQVARVIDGIIKNGMPTAGMP